MDRTYLAWRYPLCNNIDARSLCSICEDIRLLESEIQATGNNLLSLKDRSHRLASKFNAAHDPVTQKLPVEIISKIFMLFAIDSVPRNSKTYLSLGSICRAWREIAWSTPRLWTSITVDVFGAKEPPVRQNGVDIVNKWLGRSGKLPLSIVLRNSKPPIASSDLTDAYNMIEVINQYSARWHSLRINLAPEFISRLKGAAHDPSTLHTLELIGRIHIHGLTGVLFQLHAKASPAEVRLYHIRLKDVDISWNFVVRIEFRGCRLDECFEIVRRAPCMTTFRISELFQIGEDYPLPQTIEMHPSIWEIAISASPQSLMAQFLDRMSLPALRNLLLIKGKGTLPTESIISLISRSTCQLKSMVFEDLEFEIHDIVRLLNQTPALRQLRLISSLPFGPDTNCLQTLFTLISASANIKPGESGSFLPNLEILAILAPRTFAWTSVPSLTGHDENDISPLESQDIGRYRRPLKELILAVQLSPGQTDYIDKDVIPGLLRLVQQGVSLEIFENIPGQLLKNRKLLELSMAFHGLSGLQDAH